MSRENACAMAVPDLVIFDCDGVLVDSEPLSNLALVRALAAAGVDVGSDEPGRRYQGMTTRDMLGVIESDAGRPLPPGWRKELERTEAELYRTELRPTDGVADVIALLGEHGIPCCVGTQGVLEMTLLKLEATGLLRFFDRERIFSGEQVPRPKPFPDLYLAAAASVGVEPGASVVIEDSPSGVKAGVAAGMSVFGYAADPDTDADGLSAAGAELFDSMNQLPALLGLAPDGVGRSG
jgi:HAD superfamily hydrolase (TIGR01509 family)